MRDLTERVEQLEAGEPEPLYTVDGVAVPESELVPAIEAWFSRLTPKELDAEMRYTDRVLRQQLRGQKAWVIAGGRSASYEATTAALEQLDAGEPLAAEQERRWAEALASDPMLAELVELMSSDEN